WPVLRGGARRRNGTGPGARHGQAGPRRGDGPLGPYLPSADGHGAVGRDRDGRVRRPQGLTGQPWLKDPSLEAWTTFGTPSWWSRRPPMTRRCTAAVRWRNWWRPEGRSRASCAPAATAEPLTRP